MKNWKTNLTGIITILLGIPSFVTAIQAWSNHQPVDWRTTAITTVLGVGLMLAKDGSSHSTIAEVEVASMTEKIKADQKAAVTATDPK